MRNDSFKTVDELVRELVDIVSKNGVLLLDIGPRPDGSIPPEPQAIFRGIGAWLKINGEAIYGTRPCRALGFGEGPANSGGGGFSDRQVDYTHHDFRFTQKGNCLYALAMDWPDADDHFLITSLADGTSLTTGGIAAVSLLGGKDPLDWKLTPAGLWIRRPEVRPWTGPMSSRSKWAALPSKDSRPGGSTRSGSTCGCPRKQISTRHAAGRRSRFSTMAGSSAARRST